MAWTLPDLITLATDRTAAYFNKYKACFDVLDQHTHDGTAGGGAVLTGLYPRRTNYVLPLYAALPGGRFTISNSPVYGPIGGVWNSTAALNDQGDWSVRLSTGDYTVHVLYRKANNGGVGWFYFNGTLLSSIDAYNSTIQTDQVATMPLSVTTNGLHTITLKMLTKNSSSGGYGFWISALVFSQ